MRTLLALALSALTGHAALAQHEIAAAVVDDKGKPVADAVVVAVPADGGLRLPTLPVLIAYVNACGGDIADWEDRWSRLSKSAKQRTAVAIPNTPQPGQAPQAPPQQNPRQTGEIYVITSAKQREGQW